MRAYLAIIKDSFREALASRVLWILLVLTTLVLLALVPLGITEHPGARISVSDLHVPELVEQLQQGQQASGDSPAKRVFSMLSEPLQERVLKYEPAKKPSASTNFRATLQAELNALVDRRDLYVEPTWTGIELGSAADALATRGLAQLNQQELARFNRQALQAAFPGAIDPAKPETIQVTYAGMDLTEAYPGDKKKTVKEVVTLFVDFFVGTIGIFIATLVTASIIPNTYEPGAIDLLLSKPVSRSLVFLTKFLGGCMFTLVNAAYVLAGVWLICGLRHDVWSNKLLLCIPIFMFLFAIYYSVSALLGAIWRNPIICVALTVLFWFVCFSLGTSKQLIDMLGLDPTRIVKLVEADGDVVAINQSAQFLVLKKDSTAWQECLTSTSTQKRRVPPWMLPTPLGPIYDAKSKRVFTMEQAMAFGGGGEVLLWARAKDDYLRHEGPSCPSGTSAMFVAPDHELVTVGPRGVFQLQGDPESALAKPIKILGYQLPAPKNNVSFMDVGPPLPLNIPTVAAMDPASGSLAIHEQQHLRVLERGADDKYTLRAEIELEKPQEAVIAHAGKRVMLATADGWIRFYSAEDLSLQQELQPKGKTAPRFAAASPDGHWFAVLFHNRELWLHDALNDQPVDEFWNASHGVSAIHFPDNDRMLAIDLYSRLTEYQLDSFSALNSRRGPMSPLEITYVYGISPLYTVFPKPGELGNVVSYLLNETDSAAVTEQKGLEGYRATVNIWPPIISNLAFIAVMVGLGCLYTHFKDF